MMKNIPLFGLSIAIIFLTHVIHIYFEEFFLKKTLKSIDWLHIVGFISSFMQSLKSLSYARLRPHRSFMLIQLKTLKKLSLIKKIWWFFSPQGWILFRWKTKSRREKGVNTARSGFKFMFNRLYNYNKAV